MTRQRLLHKIHVLRNLSSNQFCSTFYLIEVLHGSLRIRQVLQHLVLYLVHPVHCYSYSRFSGNNLLLGLLTLAEQIVQHGTLCANHCRQGWVGLLCKALIREYQKRNETNQLSFHRLSVFKVSHL